MQSDGKTKGKDSARKAGEDQGRLEARRLNWYIAAVTAALVVLIGVGVMIGRALLRPLPEQSDVTPPRAAQVPGYYMRRLEDGVSCRVTVFDQNSGEVIEERTTGCEELRGKPLPHPAPGPGFSKPGGFSWGSQ
jgi:hypothetical protein